ncbi:methyltransferase [Nitrogeniibacter mangrovi]|uniref:Methyltransferase n=2 Tax=Nitrogeniibacter mangrovi TaxID=2016596 RepID=A0A6C1BA56_9RHOO|nr:methyltransferase [Nitrogeniibacter mangrovi]
MPLLDRFLALQDVLAAHEDLWRPQPFRGRDLPWRVQRPALAAAVDALGATQVAALEADPDALMAWLGTQVPALADLPMQVALPAMPRRMLAPTGPHFDWSIPGRKRAQIEAFAEHVTTDRAPVLEWCAGKGHLGRRLALAEAVPVRSLEIDSALAAHCEALARRAGLDQQAVCADALVPDSRLHVADRHVVALHACGELHRTLVRHAADDAARGYSIAPCCYYRWAGEVYRPLSAQATLRLDEGALRLAVTETVTAAARDQTRSRREQAFKLGFVALRAALTGTPYRSFKPVPPAWAREGFEAFCRRLAGREGVTLPDGLDWRHWEAAGWRRQDEVARDALVRHALRRALEVWLVADLALALETAGFETRVGVFCPRHLTPRNLLIDARR